MMRTGWRNTGISWTWLSLAMLAFALLVSPIACGPTGAMPTDPDGGGDGSVDDGSNGGSDSGGNGSGSDGNGGAGSDGNGGSGDGSDAGSNGAGSDDGGSNGDGSNGNGSNSGDGNGSGGDGGGNDNGNGDGGNSGGADLTAIQNAANAAAERAVAQTETMLTAIGALYPLGLAELDFEIIAATAPVLVSSGSCPALAGAFSDTNGFVQLSYPFGGCISPSNGTANLTGSIRVDTDDVSPLPAMITIDYGVEDNGITSDTFSVEGVAVEGSLTGTLTNIEGGVTLSGPLSLMLSNGASVSGNITVSLLDSGGLLILFSTLTLSDADGALSVTFNSLAADPLNDVTFVPEGGSLSFTVSAEGAQRLVTVGFSEASQSTGAVSVSVDGGAAATVVVPGLTLTPASED